MTRHKVALLFNANKEYDRQILKGIGHYLQTTQPPWDLYLEDDFRVNAANVAQWQGDGIIADFDNKVLAQTLSNLPIPVIAVGGSLADAATYSNCPYVATDNAKLVALAFNHLLDAGIERFAFYGMPATAGIGWAMEREEAFYAVLPLNKSPAHIFRGVATDTPGWQNQLQALGEWLVSLPKPVGIIAATDVHARYLIQACQRQALLVPEDVAIIGIDNDELAKSLSAISISSVKQGCFNMGLKAASVLDSYLAGQATTTAPILVAPEGVVARASSAFTGVADPLIKRAIHFIRMHAVSGIKVTQVANYLQISRFQLESRFLAEVGHSVHQELHNQKLAYACQMLQTTDEPLADIARLSGYSSKHYLSAVLQRHYNLTPLQYRQQKSSVHSA